MWTLIIVSYLFVSFVLATPAPDEDGKYTISSPSGSLRASFIPYGASISNLYIPDRNGTIRDVILGYDNASTYASDPIHPNYGATPGRYANRIVNATYVLDDKRYYTQRNAENSTMHSGTNGWSYRYWNISAITNCSIEFSLRDESNSSMGMPGLVLARVLYELLENEWRIRIEAEAKTHDTPLMATNHAYWNLDAFANPANDTILNHTFSMPFARRMTAYDEPAAMPNGTLLTVPKDSINDFWSAPKHVGANDTASGWVGNCGPGFGGYDCGWLTDRNSTDAGETQMQHWVLEPVASLWSEWSGIRWDMYSNQDGIAMTSCGFFPPKLLPLKSTQGGPASDGYVPTFGAIAVEAQDWMSGINFPQWGRFKKQVFGPSSDMYVNEIRYKFSIV